MKDGRNLKNLLVVINVLKENELRPISQSFQDFDARSSREQGCRSEKNGRLGRSVGREVGRIQHGHLSGPRRGRRGQKNKIRSEPRSLQPELLRSQCSNLPMQYFANGSMSNLMLHCFQHRTRLPIRHESLTSNLISHSKCSFSFVGFVREVSVILHRIRQCSETPLCIFEDVTI